MSLHLLFSAQPTDPAQHASRITQKFNSKNIHRKARKKLQWWVVWARRVEAQEPNYCSKRKAILRCEQP